MITCIRLQWLLLVVLLLTMRITVATPVVTDNFTGHETLNSVGLIHISTIDGLRPIDEIKVGDLVWSKDDKTGEIDLKPVVNLPSQGLNHRL